MKPTAYLRFRVENQFSSHGGYRQLRILQQWWTTSQYVPVEGSPDGCLGEWRDVPLAHVDD